MRIGIDVRYLSHGLVGGVHTYIAHFVPALLELAEEHRVFLYADTKRAFELEDLPRCATVRILPWRNALSSVYQDFAIRHWMTGDRLDVAHFPANYGFGPSGIATLITLHDAINILPLREIVRGHHKNPRTIGMMTYLHYWSLASLQRADLVLTVSAHAANDIARHAKLDRDRIVPIHHAPTPDLHHVTDPRVLADVRRRHSLPETFVLADALKNPAVLVNAWRLLPSDLRHDRQIVFFSRRPDPPHVVHEAVESGDARLLLNVPRKDLIALYSMANAFVFPSWIEGFGIPLLEAMTCGAPVIASNRGAIPEVLGDAGLLIDAEDAAGLAAHLTAVLTRPDLASSLRQQGFARAAHFSWSGAAQATLASYERATVRSRIQHRRS